MLSQRVLQQSARRLAQSPPVFFNASRPIAAVVNTAIVQNRITAPTTTRAASSAANPAEETSDLLIKQRRFRPVSPHLTIYKPQIPWILSSLNRITGVTLSGTFYLFGLAYLAAPAFGLQLGSAALAAGFAKWPLILKGVAKFSLALPFTFHSFNGIRHLIWDTGSLFKNQQVIATGWTVVGLSVASALALLFV